MKLPTMYESRHYRQARDNRFTFRDIDIGECSDEEYDESHEEFEFVKTRIKFLRQNLNRAINRVTTSHIVEVDADYCFEIGVKQDWECALTGDELEFTRGGYNWLGKWCNPQSCTIDRIDSSKGYVFGNIQLVTWEANCLKQHMGNDEFVAFCKAVADYN